MLSKEEAKDYRRRVFFFEALFFLAAAIILLRLFFVSVLDHGRYAALAENQHGYYQKLIPKRGNIYISDKYSQKDYPVATNAYKDLVYVVPKEVRDPYQAAADLSKILSLDQKEIYDKITVSKKAYLPIKKTLSDEESKAIANAKLPGVYLDQENIRYYPEGNFLSQVVGFLGFTDTSEERIGVYGLEKAFDKELAGKTGEIDTEADLRGNWITGSKRSYTPAEDGISLKLTIDRAIQFKVENVLKDTVVKHGAESGSVIVADPKTGAIIAMANYPSFDLNNYNKVTDSSIYVNSAAVNQYEPGSTMKAVTMVAGIDLGLVSPSSTYNDTGTVVIDGHSIKNSDGKAHGIVPMTEVINQSLNTGAIYVEQQIGNERFLNYLQKFGFGRKTNIEVQENSGNLNNLINSKVQINYFTAAFGQAIAVTPLQMLQSYLPMANKGKLMQLHLVGSEISPDGKEKKFEPKELATVISEQTSKLISAMLVDNVENGHGKRAGVKGYYVGGKTGTAQVASNGGYVQNDNNGSFVGYAPIEDPKFVMIVNINRPQDVKFAETTAAPAFGSIAEFILNYYGIAPTRK